MQEHLISRRQLVDSLKAGGYTAAWTFAGLFGASLLGWLNTVVAWATSDAPIEAFPEASVLLKGLVAASGAAFGGLIGTVVRLAQSALGRPIPSYPGTTTGDPDDGTVPFEDSEP